MRVAAFTQGLNTPSARFRVRQYVSELASKNIFVDEFGLGRLLEQPSTTLMKALRGPRVGAALVRALYNVGQARWQGYDVTFLQREMIPTLATWEGLTKTPRILDVDDSIYLRKGGLFRNSTRIVEKISKSADLVICGNNFLAERFSRWNKSISVIPTGVDTSRFVPKASVHKEDFVVGWTGTSANLKYLYMIEPALKVVLRNLEGCKLRVVCEAAPKFAEIPESRIEYVKWSAENEVTSIQDISIGIMPLMDSEWERGKCSYKMLLYMACGIPVVVSPVGMNQDVLSLGQIGLAATSENSWTDALLGLLKDYKSRNIMGLLGRKIVEANFSLGHIAQKLESEFRALVS